jgi:hypothetical protein
LSKKNHLQRKIILKLQQISSQLTLRPLKNLPN